MWHCGKFTRAPLAHQIFSFEILAQSFNHFKVLQKKADALVGRVNTFIILHTLECTLKIGNLYGETLKIYKFQNSE
jgi:hypothetical protein